ncbi:MAG: hypothetical protein AABW72_05185 [archaeon]
MSSVITKTEFEVYSYFYNKYGLKPFGIDTLKWFFSKQMIKKILFNLSKAKWLERAGRGIYKCATPEKAVGGIFESRIEEKLKDSGLKYCYFGASAAEIWSDDTYIQRSWEYSPYFIEVLERDLGAWKKFFQKEGISFFIKRPSNILGEFTVLFPKTEITCAEKNGKPVMQLNETIDFCEKNIDTFEYVLAYLAKKYHKKTNASKEILEKVGEAL